VFLGSAQRDIERLPGSEHDRLFAELDRVRRGLEPRHWKPMSTVGSGVREIRVSTGRAFRAMYVTSFGDAVYVLHVFEKKSQKTAIRDIEVARARLAQLRRLKEEK